MHKLIVAMLKKAYHLEDHEWVKTTFYKLLHHNIIQIHSNVLWGWQYYEEYSRS